MQPVAVRARLGERRADARGAGVQLLQLGREPGRAGGQLLLALGQGPGAFQVRLRRREVAPQAGGEPLCLREQGVPPGPGLGELPGQLRDPVAGRLQLRREPPGLRLGRLDRRLGLAQPRQLLAGVGERGGRVLLGQVGGVRPRVAEARRQRGDRRLRLLANPLRGLERLLRRLFVVRRRGPPGGRGGARVVGGAADGAGLTGHEPRRQFGGHALDPGLADLLEHVPALLRAIDRGAPGVLGRLQLGGQRVTQPRGLQPFLREAGGGLHRGDAGGHVAQAPEALLGAVQQLGQLRLRGAGPRFVLGEPRQFGVQQRGLLGDLPQPGGGVPGGRQARQARRRRTRLGEPFLDVVPLGGQGLPPPDQLRLLPGQVGQPAFGVRALASHLPQALLLGEDLAHPGDLVAQLPLQRGQPLRIRPRRVPPLNVLPL
nr:hypothetical protein GCM10017588_00650 [Microbispora rosea subsp. aerata]